ncbi:MAG: type II toxin-antitoxin system PemK/MazF family toxin [Proteobacteria bacterium]|uniref:Type II toxin-antitoxin system PemK/MazF family toxin n=1 Tax=Candidatus Desulfatibia profunda TaxID=2841695 RepID=A0A8J6TG04_9BACT|nr:type II toxin-antitoxin system PemK/MazF family toxin [Candidatus Desulfatibia profunda]MBU0699516.1 type II toxin-antitoxin system PemK/MazF family toxin [Pseudomonadota bacterium]
MDWRMAILTPKRYEIFFADLNPTMGSEIKKIRPVVIISQDEMNKYLETVVVCPLTSKLHPLWRSRLQIVCAGEKAEIAIDQIRTISKQRLKQKIDQISSEDAAQLRRLITEMYGE